MHLHTSSLSSWLYGHCSQSQNLLYQNAMCHGEFIVKDFGKSMGLLILICKTQKQLKHHRSRYETSNATTVEMKQEGIKAKASISLCFQFAPLPFQTNDQPSLCFLLRPGSRALTTGIKAKHKIVFLLTRWLVHARIVACLIVHSNVVHNVVHFHGSQKSDSEPEEHCWEC